MDVLVDSWGMRGNGDPLPTTEKSVAFFACSMVLPVFLSRTYLLCCANLCIAPGSYSWFYK
jgi:hypothetical protein